MMQAFSRAAVKPDASSAVNFHAAILRERPDLWGTMPVSPRQGETAHTLFLGDEAFKAPKRSLAIADFNVEPETLRRFERTGLPVPRVVYIGEDSVFYSMTRLPGVSLKSILETLTPEEEQIIARDITGFIIDMARAMPVRDGKFMAHGDLHAGNILVDPETKRLTGVIDFGLIAYFPKGMLMDCMREPALNKLVTDEYRRRKSELPDITFAPRAPKTP